MCPDDYKRLRHSRNKQGEYNTRRQAERAAAQAAVEKTVQAALFSEPQPEGPAIMAAPREIPEENLEAVDSDAASFMSDNDDLSVAPDVSSHL